MLAAFESNNSRDIVKADYDRSAILRQLADENDVALLAVHHQNKGKDQDQAIDSINGTTGVTAGVDSIIILEEKRGQKLMQIKSREIEDAELAISFDLKRGGWSVEGPAQEIMMSTERKTILTLLTDTGPMTPKAIGAALNKNSNTTRGLLLKLRKDEVLRFLPNGAYWFAKGAVPAGYDEKLVFGVKPPEADPTDVPC